MKITECRVAGDELCLRSTDFTEIRRWAYNFKAGDYEIVRRRKKRSNDANAYAWRLIGEIANVLRADKDEVYIDMLHKYGQQFVCKIPNSHRSKFERSTKYWEIHESLPPEEKAQYYRVFVGSSNYDTQEMSILIDGIIDEAKNLDIEVISEREKSLLLEEWGKV
ncbi:MAG: hypothetical protein J6S71_00625 [Clostridia bacterium]|nr:hypothetical protein [Clostridia bacterium]